MKEIPILEWEDVLSTNGDDYILRLPYSDMESIEVKMEEIEEKEDTIYGLLAPYSPENVEFNIRCAARIRDRFPLSCVYIAVPMFKTYDRIKTIFQAGFAHIAVPYYLGGIEYDHYFQFIQPEMLNKMTLHIAGGMFTSECWNLERWTWSKEKL